jgi:hypothetical protein
MQPAVNPVPVARLFGAQFRILRNPTDDQQKSPTTPVIPKTAAANPIRFLMTPTSA